MSDKETILSIYTTTAGGAELGTIYGPPELEDALEAKA
mgnify:CR=1 FL=1